LLNEETIKQDTKMQQGGRNQSRDA